MASKSIATLSEQGRFTRLARALAGGRGRTMMRGLFSAAGWLVLAFIAWATLAPIGSRPGHGGPVLLQHLAAFALAAGCFTLASGRARWRPVLLLLCVAAIGFEIAQGFTPDRHARAVDALEKILGAGLGVAIGCWLDGVLNRLAAGIKT